MRHAVMAMYIITSFFSIIVNFEFMQTINDKWKCKLQQLFEMLPLSLDAGLNSFYPLVNGPVSNGQFEVSQDLKESLLQFSQVVCCVLQHGAVVAMETTQLALNLYQAFQTHQSAIKCGCILQKIIRNGHTLTKLCESVLGVRFF